ncbi:hypothetical protein D9758_001237 [Tetrapyrgos nigripes]|uniref:Uncharacterized protein n=1 Tax=Tetrapyrgos nigripes TaxID=182062 RepID=A0A8H5GRZ7_9AGAR|nr:hypothetical protein D9758_001237 [Tetrapyrgos nigripes]
MPGGNSKESTTQLIIAYLSSSLPFLSLQLMSPVSTSGVAQPAPASKQPHELASSKKPSAPVPIKPTSSTIQQKRRSSKPIINWLQRKLGGSARAKRADLAAQLGGKGLGSRASNRVASSPLPNPVPKTKQHGKTDALRRKTISLNDDDDTRDASPIDDHDEESISDSARDSLWSPSSALEADEDASLRPLPPSSPPSPSPSRSSSSYLSDPRTFKSIAASTKPTTLLSIDLNGNGMAHIAQAPITPVSQTTRSPHVRNSSTSTAPNLLGSGASITFAPLPPSPQSSSRPDSLRETGSATLSNNGIVQAPLHTTHHPRNNPRPSSPPLDNASVLTLASSAYAIPGLRVGTVTPAWGSAPPSAVGGAGDSVSHFGGTYEDVESTSQLALGDDDRLDDRDADASLRALRPRSTRRGSWESEASRWSARIQAGTGTPSLARDRSLWTANSIRTGAFSAENEDTDDKSDEAEVAENDAEGDVSTSTEAAADSVTDLTVPVKGVNLATHPVSVPVSDSTQGDVHVNANAEAPAVVDSATRHDKEEIDGEQQIAKEVKADVLSIRPDPQAGGADGSGVSTTGQP